MILLWIGILAQAKGGLLLADNQRFYEPYRECVLSSVKSFSKASEPADNVKKAAYSECRTVKVKAMMDSLRFHLSQPAAQMLDHPQSYDDSDHFDEFDRLLDEDATAIILKSRMR